MKLPKELITVTPLSKFLAMVTFVTLPIVGFFLGMQYQSTMTDETNYQTQSPSSAMTPTSIQILNQTSTWKSYHNEKLAYSFKYPSDWNFLDKTTGNDGSNVLQTAYFNYSDKTPQPDNTVTLSVLSGLDPKRLKESKGYGDAGMASEDAEKTIEIMDGKEIIKVHRKFSELNFETKKWENTGEKYFIYIPLDKNYLILSGSLTIRNTLDQILSTFQFSN